MSKQKMTSIPQAHVDNLYKRIAELEKEREDDYGEASTYAMSLFNTYYKNKPDAVGFELCESVAAIITQIDNMATGVIAELEKALKAVKKDLLMRAEEDSHGCKVAEL